MGWLWLVGSIKLLVSFVKEPCKRDIILQKRHTGERESLDLNAWRNVHRQRLER